jgi:hypothetical protein
MRQVLSIQQQQRYYLMLSFLSQQTRIFNSFIVIIVFTFEVTLLGSIHFTISWCRDSIFFLLFYGVLAQYFGRFRPLFCLNNSNS